MSTRGRLGFGAFFAAVGALVWALLLVPIGSRAEVQVIIDRDLAQGVTAYQVFDVPGLERSLRLQALVVGLGGLLLLARGWRRGVRLSLAMGLLWTLAEVALELKLVMVPTSVGVAAGVVLVLLVGVTAEVCRRNAAPESDRAAWWLLVYAGLAGMAGPDWPLLRYLAYLPGTLPAVVPLLVLAVPLCALVAAAMAPPRPARGQYLGAGLAVASVVTGALYAVIASRFDFGDGSWPIGVLGALGTKALLGTACVALTGAFGRGWRVPDRVLAVLAAMLPLTVGIGAAARALPYITEEFVERPPVLFMLLDGLLVGFAGLAAARVLGGASAAAGESQPAGAAGRWRPAIGWLLTGAGVLGWAVHAAVVGPAARDVLRSWERVYPYGRPTFVDVDDADGLGILTRDLRWAAILLAIGGLLLVARTGRARTILAPVVVGWLALDLVLAALDVRGWPVAAILTVGLFSLLVSLMLLGRGPTQAAGPWTIVYSGAAVLTAGVTFSDAQTWMPQFLPSWALESGLAITALLAVTAVAAALAAAPRVGAVRLAFALVVIMAAGASAWLTYRSGLAGPDPRRAEEAWRLLRVAWPGLIVVACALLAGGLHGRGRRWWVIAGSTVLSVLGVATAIFGGIIVAASAQRVVAATVDDALSGYPIAPAAIMAGAAVGLLALLPHALSTSDGNEYGGLR